MARRRSRPKVIHMDPIKANAVRGPHADDPELWYWQAVVRDPVLRTRRTVWSGWATRADAQVALAALVAEGVDVMAPLPELSQVKTVQDLLEVWLYQQEHHGGRKGPITPNTLRIYTAAARHLVTGIGDVRLSKLARSTIERHRDRRLRAGAAASTVRNEIDVLGFAWTWWMERSPRPLKSMPKVPVKGRPVRNRRTPTREEVLAVLGHLQGWPRMAILLLYATGARPGEIRDLVWGDVDLKDGRLHLDGKTGARSVPLDEGMVEELLSWAVEYPGLPEARLLPVKPSTFDSYLGPRALRAACKSAEVAVFTPYGLRRAAVDRMSRAGIDPATAAAYTGHSVAVMLKHYRTVTEEDLRNAAQKVGLGSLGGGRVVPFRRGKGR